MDVRPALPTDFDEVFPLLQLFGNRRMTRDDWRRMLFDLPWPVPEAHRGFILRDAGEAVGFMGTIFSCRTLGGVTRRICSTSSWIVKESHRSSSLQLVLPVLALRSHTIVNLAPSAAAYEVFARLGFRPLDTSQVLMPPFANPAELARIGRCSATTRIEEIIAGLGAEGQTIATHMAPTNAGQVLLRRGERCCHVVATRSLWKGRWMLAHVQYASDWPLLWEHLGQASLKLGRVLGTVGLRVDGRHLRGAPPLLARRRALPRPRLYRPATPDVLPEMIDGLYAETVGQRW
jgi:hypothetical protein